MKTFVTAFVPWTTKLVVHEVDSDSDADPAANEGTDLVHEYPTEVPTFAPLTPIFILIEGDDEDVAKNFCDAFSDVVFHVQCFRDDAR